MMALLNSNDFRDSSVDTMCLPRNDTSLLVIASAEGVKQSPQPKDCFVAHADSSQ